MKTTVSDVYGLEFQNPRRCSNKTLSGKCVFIKPIHLSQSCGQDNILVAITGKTGDGIAVVDLASISEPPPLTYAKQRADDHPVALGTVASLRGMTASTGRTQIKHSVSALGRIRK